MVDQNTQLRKQLFKGQALGEHARDTQRAFDATPHHVMKSVDGLFKLGMELGSPIANVEPVSVELTRCVNMIHPEVPSGCSGHVDFVWKPLNGGAVVTGITGLTPGTQIPYHMVFRFTYPAKASS